MTEAEYFTEQIKELRKCYELIDASSLLKGKSKAHRLKVEEEIAFQESVFLWIGTVRRDGIVPTLLAIRDIVIGLKQQGRVPPKNHMRSFGLATKFDKLDPHITEPFKDRGNILYQQ